MVDCCELTLDVQPVEACGAAQKSRVQPQLPTMPLATCAHFPRFFPCLFSPQEGALAYGLKLDDRVRVLPNAKLRASREWAPPGLHAVLGCTAMLNCCLVGCPPAQPAAQPLHCPTVLYRIVLQGGV